MLHFLLPCLIISSPGICWGTSVWNRKATALNFWCKSVSPAHLLPTLESPGLPSSLLSMPWTMWTPSASPPWEHPQKPRSRLPSLPLLLWTVAHLGEQRHLSQLSFQSFRNNEACTVLKERSQISSCGHQSRDFLFVFKCCLAKFLKNKHT